jgi:hypothetical protein
MSSVEVCLNALCDVLFLPFYLCVTAIENNPIVKKGDTCL